MTRKILMIGLYLLIGWQAKASIDRAPASETENKQSICMIQTGDVQLKYRGTYEDAFAKVTEECFQMRNDNYRKARKAEPDQDRQILFVQSCANSVQCT